LKKIAVVTMSHVLEEEDLSSDELIEQIRRAVDSSSLSKSWIVERITVLDDSLYGPKSIITSGEDIRESPPQPRLQAQ
jgi:hypothetical protein